MADNVPITAGSGTTIGTDEQTIGGTAVQIQLVRETAGDIVVSQNTSVGTTAAAVGTSQECHSLLIQADLDNTDRVIVGNSTAQYHEMEPGDSVVLAVKNRADAYAKSRSGTQTINLIASVKAS